MSYLRRLNVLANHVGASPSVFSTASVGKNICSNRKARPVVIGGMVLDIQATPVGHEIQPGTTTPGEVCYVRGGVARNIAECLAKLGMQPFLISVVGDDVAGKFFLEHWRSLGLSVDGIRVCVGASTPVISAVFDKKGELAAAVADTDTIEVYLTPEWISSFMGEIQSASVVLVDANLAPTAINVACTLASLADVPVWFEPVSVAKSVRATHVLSAITYVSPNEAELVAMANALPPKKSDATAYQLPAVDWRYQNPAFAMVRQLEECIGKLLEAGVKYIVLTLGSEGAVLCSREPLGKVACLHYPALSASVVKLTGAGDSLVAGTLAALSDSMPEVQALAYGLAAAKLTVESELNVAESLSWAAIADDAEVLSPMAQEWIISSRSTHLSLRMEV